MTPSPHPEEKLWYENAKIAMGNGIEESLGWCDREELTKYTEWLVTEAERRGAEKEREEIKKMVEGKRGIFTNDKKAMGFYNAAIDDILSLLNSPKEE